jgi:hypothetical protein
LWSTAGVHRAAVAVARLIALLQGITIQDSIRLVKSCRNVDYAYALAYQGERDSLRNWLYRPLSKLPRVVEKPTAFRAAGSKGSLLHALVAGIPVCKHKQDVGAGSKRLESQRLESENIMEAVTWGKEWCRTCFASLTASQRALI